MTTQKLISISALIALIVAVGYFFTSMSDHDQEHSVTSKSENGEVPPGMHRMPDGSLMANDAAGHSMDHSSMLVASERAFIEGMIPHHQEAIDTAKEVLARGGSTDEIKTLAQNIIAAQEGEIAQMKEWYRSWYGAEYQDTGVYQPMMRDLSNLSGAELDRVFLEDMIPHHEGALMMVESVKPYIEHDEIRTLGDAIVTSQSAEIEYMRELLLGL